MCVLLNLLVALVGVAILYAIFEAIIRTIRFPPFVSPWMWVFRVIALLILAIIVYKVFFGGGLDVQLLRIC